MKKLMKCVTVILGLGLIGLTTTANAQYPKTKAPGEICYYFYSQGLLGEWEGELLVSKKKLTEKQAAAYMQKNHGLSDIYDIEVLPEDECDAAIVSYSFKPGYLFYYKQPKAAAKAPAKAKTSKAQATQTKPKTQAQPVKKTSTTANK